MTSAHQDVDAWLEKLRECKPLDEAEVKALTDKVSINGDTLSQDGS
jgi:hypothetical protein